VESWFVDGVRRGRWKDLSQIRQQGLKEGPVLIRQDPDRKIQLNRDALCGTASE